VLTSVAGGPVRADFRRNNLAAVIGGKNVAAGTPNAGIKIGIKNKIRGTSILVRRKIL
jgi:hypothetical protein